MGRNLMKKRLVVVFVLLLVGLAGTAANASYAAYSAKDKGDSGRLLTGKVIDHQENPLAGAVVYISNTRTRAVKTYIVGQDGTYRFPALSPNIDYEVYAHCNGGTCSVAHAGPCGVSSITRYPTRAKVASVSTKLVR